MKVLVIENEAKALNDISFCINVLYPDGEVISLAEGLKALKTLEADSPQLIIAASSLPDLPSRDLVKRIRKVSAVPLVVITEGEDVSDKARLLEEGADECVRKPISPIEFLSVVRALVRRTSGLGYKQEQAISLGNGVSVNIGTREVFAHDVRVNLTPQECTLLFELVRNRGRVVTSQFLLERAWGTEYVQERDFLKKYVYRLRCKLEADPSKPKMILSERGIGYKIATVACLGFATFSGLVANAPATLRVFTQVSQFIAAVS